MARAEARKADVTSDNATVKRGGTGFQPVRHGQDGHATINIRHGAYLPHWTKDTSIYSVTFRLADSLPKAVVEAWAAEREIIIQTAKQMNRPLTQDEEKRLQFLFSEKVDSYMDAGHGACHMKKPAVAQIVTNTLRHFDGQRYRLLVWCVMPNHVHVVFEPLPDCDLSNILHSWKSFSANLANSTLKRKGEFWQPEYFDHLIRDEADLSHSIEYVLGNPGKAGLKNWKWVSDNRESGTGFQPVKHGQDAHASSRHGQDGRATSIHGQDGRATSKHGQDGHATSRHGQDAHASSRHGQGAHATSRHGQDARASSRHGQNGRATSRNGQDGRATLKKPKS